MQVRDLIAELQRFDPHDDVKVECREVTKERRCKECDAVTTTHTNLDAEPDRITKHDGCVYIKV